MIVFSIYGLTTHIFYVIIGYTKTEVSYERIQI